MMFLCYIIVVKLHPTSFSNIFKCTFDSNKLVLKKLISLIFYVPQEFKEVTTIIITIYGLKIEVHLNEYL